MNKKETVVMIFDPEYGDRILDVARDYPVWVVGSTRNRSAVMRIHESALGIASIVTIWSSPLMPSTEEEWLSVIGDVERHHDDFSQSPPVSIIEVIGVSASEAARTAFREFEYLQIEATPLGFRAHKNRAA